MATQTIEVASASKTTFVVVGKESVGKSQLISALTGCRSSSDNFRGSTVSVDAYAAGDAVFIDTPGILRRSDTETTRLALNALSEGDTVVLVVQATHIDEDLEDMLGLVKGKRGVVVVTFWDKVQEAVHARDAIDSLSKATGVPYITVDARKLGAKTLQQATTVLGSPGNFKAPTVLRRVGWRIEPPVGILEHRILGPMASVVLVLLPAMATIFGANQAANLLHPRVEQAIHPAVLWVNANLPAWSQVLLTAEHGGSGFGLLNMGPFLLVWALPTVLLFSLIMGVYKASGLMERLTISLNPLLRPIGLTGRDAVRVMMGFGCNVPAVLSTRGCSSCSRGPAISAIAFGAACSYQLPATIAVLSVASNATAVSQPVMVFAYLTYLLFTTLVYVRLTAPRDALSELNRLMIPRRPFMEWPRFESVFREASGVLAHFLLRAIPIFLAICAIASVLARFYVFDACARLLEPILSIFNLPGEAALPLLLSCIRKDGIFLFVKHDQLAFPMTSLQVLTGVYLCGVLLPCMVTAMTIARERGGRFAGLLLLRQVAFAILFAMALAWITRVCCF